MGKKRSKRTKAEIKQRWEDMLQIYLHEDVTYGQIAKKFGVSRYWVGKIVRRFLT